MFSFYSWILGSLRPEQPKYEVHQNVFLAKFLQKINFFQKFLHFWNRLDELVGKMVLFFHFDELHILAFLALDCLKSNFKMKIYAQDTRNKLKMNCYYENILTFCLYTL